MKYSLGISDFLEEIPSLSHSSVFFCFFALITEEGFLLPLLAILWNSAFKWVYLSFSPLSFTSLLSQLFLRPCQTTFLHFIFLGTVLIPISCTISQTYFCFIDYAKVFDCVDYNKLWKILKEMGIPDHLTCLLRNLYAGQEGTVTT